MTAFNPREKLRPVVRQNAASRVATAASRPQGLIDIRVDYGPADLLGRFFAMADYALREVGLDMTFGTFEDLVRVNAANADSWKPLITTFDPAYGLLADENAFVLVGRDKRGEPVTIQAMRCFDWRGSSFKVEAESLRLFFADPAAMARKGEQCWVTAPSAGTITGLVAF